LITWPTLPGPCYDEVGTTAVRGTSHCRKGARGQWSGRTLLSPANYLDWQARARSFESMGAFERTDYNLATEGEPERVPAARITASLFPTLGMAPLAGRLFGADEDRPQSTVAVISHSLWQRRFGLDPDVVGQTLRLDGRLYSIVGVMPEHFNFPEYAEVWTPLGLEVGGRRDEHRIEVLACLPRDTPLAKAQSEAEAIAAQLAREHPESNQGRSARVRPYIEAFTPPGVVIGMYLVLAAGLFVQLIASANVANLLLKGRQRHDTALLRFGRRAAC
jgi:putative ABC transport system permease protein